jgi:hypothetical protein
VMQKAAAPPPNAGKVKGRKSAGPKKNARARESEQVDEEEHEEDEEVRRPSKSREFSLAASGSLGKRQPKITSFVRLRLEAGVEGTAKEDAAAEGNVPPHMQGSELDLIYRNSEREEAVAEATKQRQGRKNKRGHQLDPAQKNWAKSACWVFFRKAKKGEEADYIYCRACEYVDNGAAPNSKNRVRIQDAGTPEASLNKGNAESHLKQHKKWWTVIQDLGRKGLDVRRGFEDLMRTKKRRVVQGQGDLDDFVTKAASHPGLVEKELRLVIWMVRNKIPFHALDDPSFKEMLKSFGVQLSSSKTLKRYLLVLSEIALRHAERQIKEAGTYSIALDYWTSIAKDKYLAITYHYADKNLNVRSRVLDLVPVAGNATALLSAELVGERLEKHFEQKRVLFK